MKKLLVSDLEMIREISLLLSMGKDIIFKPKGNSMLPFIIGETDSVVLRKKDEYSKGDIVLAEVFPNQYVLHRIVNIVNEQYILRGDGNINRKEECRQSEILGYVKKICKKDIEVNCDNRKEQLKAKLWNFLYPIRRYLLVIYKQINKN